LASGFGVMCSTSSERNIEQIVATLSRQLTDEFGRGWNKAALTRTMQFAERFSDPKIVATLSQQSTWSHVVELLPLKDSLQRDFYAEMCRLENWSVRQRSGQRRRA
jgi:hypothetical protein